MSLIPYKRNVEVEKRVLEELLGGLPPNPLTDGNVQNTSYKNVIFESLAYRKPNETNKELLTYEVSLARLQKAGFKRHARSCEVFGLLADNLENKLFGNLKILAEDMLVSYGEWLSLAFERDGNKLFVYIDPEGLSWNGTTYVKKNFKHTGVKREFSVKGKPSEQWIKLKTFDDEFVKLVYGRAFKDLPAKMQAAKVALPKDGEARPVGRDSYSDCYVVNGGYGNGASRGVR